MDLNPFLNLMSQKKASDLFITAKRQPSIKIEGVIKAVTREILTEEQAKALVFSIMNEKQRDEFETTHECNFAIETPEAGRFRVSAFYQRNNTGMVLRRIESKIPTFEELHLPEILKELSMQKRGIVIFAGGTGVGKSTSLAAMIGHRNQHGKDHIITIEDPIEFIHEHNNCIITQREVGVDTESFEVALKNTLRQAPNVIMIGEVRTEETMKFAISFAETGHLVFATLHANNTYQALERILHFVEDSARDNLSMDLSLNVKAIVAQQLIPIKDGNGLHPSVEVLLNTPLIQDLIRKGDIHKIKEIMKQSTNQGMKTFDQAIFDLYQEGIISYDDALKHADSANEVRLLIKLSQGTDLDDLSSGLKDIKIVDDDN